ncbi:hypothetical protein LCM10_05115 [Rossellomorea aquimaris]|uniref:hypothetical protein n=1 Tax=Rossellomorea aquimaris TaxID=189382 RepID=UPI001CD477CE|nr:hypothetical protein [Rossellomorea aquimaris]MCA1054358.1 hypothetical protein [Rossellomorea aquimaris]
MSKLRILTIILLSLSLLSGIALYGLYHYKIVRDDYTELLVWKDGQIVYEIDDTEQITAIKDKINKSPRHYRYDNGFRYDSVPIGVLTFKKAGKKKQLGFVTPEGNVFTKYWLIETKFDFGENPNADEKQKIMGSGF